jgi:Bacteriocin-protection, YdeI or OmpD-Associated
MLAKKLQIKSGYNVLIINQPVGFMDLFTELPENVHLSYEITNQDQSFDVILSFAINKTQMDQFVPQAIQALKRDGILWVSYPKKSSKLKTDITRDHGWQILKENQFRPVTQISIDDTWSALRFKPESQTKTKKHMTIPEIDLENRIVRIPADFKDALLAEGLLEMFEKMSFTNRKEKVLEIVTAKKPETRQRRINKTITALKHK